jgi:anthranilate phosphoribosyltransferase
VFGGARGAVADALNLNAGVALAAAELAADAKEGVAMAQEAQRRWEDREGLPPPVACAEEGGSLTCR